MRMDKSFVRAVVSGILRRSVELGVCARCGGLVVVSENDVRGKLFGKDDVLFYICSGCFDFNDGRFFKFSWFEPYIKNVLGEKNDSTKVG